MQEYRDRDHLSHGVDQAAPKNTLSVHNPEK